MWENSSVSRSYICVRFSEHQRLKNLRVCREREHTFTSPFLLLAACHVVSCSFAVSFDWSNRSNFVASRRAASHLPFGRISRPSVAARIQCPCKANGGSGTAVNYPLYTALPLELILNDPSNLTREREGELRKKDKRCVSRPCAKERRKFTGPRRSRDDVRPRLKTRRRREMETRGESFRESYLVF